MGPISLSGEVPQVPRVPRQCKAVRASVAEAESEAQDLPFWTNFPVCGATA